LDGSGEKVKLEKLVPCSQLAGITILLQISQRLRYDIFTSFGLDELVMDSLLVSTLNLLDLAVCIFMAIRVALDKIESLSSLTSGFDSWSDLFLIECESL
jgi:hypothetical protein